MSCCILGAGQQLSVCEIRKENTSQSLCTRGHGEFSITRKLIGGNGDRRSFELQRVSDAVNEQHLGEVLPFTPQELALRKNNLI